MENRPKNDPKSFQMHPWRVFGAKSRQGRRQGAHPRLKYCTSPFGAFLPKTVAPRADVWSHVGPKAEKTSMNKSMPKSMPKK